MAAARKCDRCGAFYEKNTRFPCTIRSSKTAIDGICFTTYNDSTAEYVELCDDCLGMLKLFLNGNEVVLDKEETQ